MHYKIDFICINCNLYIRLCLFSQKQFISQEIIIANFHTYFTYLFSKPDVDFERFLFFCDMNLLLQFLQLDFSNAALSFMVLLQLIVTAELHSTFPLCGVNSENYQPTDSDPALSAFCVFVFTNFKYQLILHYIA